MTEIINKLSNYSEETASRVMYKKKLTSAILCLLFTCNNVFALNAATDLIEHTSSINPTTNGNITNITTTHNIDTYHWSSFNIAGNETANFIFGANGQTALNYLSPGANASAIYGSIMSSGAKGNILLFNPNGIMMGAGASVSGANTFFASTNKFDGIVDGKVTFSEAEKNNPLTIGNIKFNDVNNVHFVAPNVIVNADNLTTSNSISFRAIGGGEYDINANLFSNKIGVKNPITNTNMLDVNANITSNKVTIDAKADADTYATALVSGDIKANKAIKGENGEIYIIASNDNTSSNAGIQVTQNATISGDSANVDINTQNLVQNGNIDVSGETGGNVNITVSKEFDQNTNISAKGTESNGGNVKINTGNITTIASATTDVSGETGGGTINETATDTIIQKGTLKANTLGENGDGGSIKLVAKNKTDAYNSTIEAKKGSISGDGGQVELSARGEVLFSGSQINTTGGFLTIDPANYVVDSTLAAEIIAALAGSSMSYLADNDITVNSAISWTSANTLTFDAGRNVAINADVTATAGALNILANDVTAAGIILANRGTGAGGITMGSATTINCNTVAMTIESGVVGGTTYESGVISLNNVTTTNSLVLHNFGLINSADVIINGLLNINGVLAISADGGNITQSSSSVITDASTTQLSSNGDITLDNINNYFRDAVSATSTGSTTIVDKSNLVMGTVSTGGNLSLTAKGEILQSGVITVTNGATSLSGKAITLDNTANNFSGAVSATSTGGYTTIYDATALVMGTVSVSGGDLSLNALGGNLTQDPSSGGISVTGSANLSSGGDISLDNINNDFKGFVYVDSTRAFTIDDKNDLLVGPIRTNPGKSVTLVAGTGGTGNLDLDGTITVGSGGNLSLTANGGNIFQGGAITVTNGTTSLSSKTITLDNTANDFGGAVSATSTGYTTIVDANNLVMGTVSTGENLSLTAGGSITQDSSSTGITVGSITNLNSTSDGDITLDNVNNDFKGFVYVDSTRAFTIDDKNDLLVGPIRTNPGKSVTLVAGTGGTGNLDLDGTITVGSGGNLSLTANGGNIFQGGAITVTNGTTSLSSKTITLDNTANDFGGAVSATSTGYTTIVDANNLVMGTVSTGENLSLTAGGSITQTGAITVNNDATTSLTATLGNIILGNTGNDFSGAVSATSEGATTINDTNALVMGTVYTGGNLSLAAGGSITQTGAITVNNDATTSLSGNNITLNNTNNDFSGAVSVNSSGNTQLSDSNNLALNTSNISGTLIALAGQDINITGNLQIDEGAEIDASGSININSNITTTNGNVTMKANNNATSKNPVNITMAKGTTISAVNGDINIQLIGTEASNAETITLSNLTGETVFVRNQSLNSGSNLIINLNSTITETLAASENALTLVADGGNFINNSGAGALETVEGNRWLVYSGSPSGTTLGGLVPVNTYYSSTYDTTPPESVAPGDSVLYKATSPPGGGGGGGGSSSGGAIAGGTIGGVAAAGAAAGYYGLGLLPGLLLGLASPIQFDESMIDVICKSQKEYPLLTRNIQYVYNTDDICELDPNKIGHNKFIPDLSINNGSYQLIKIQIPPQFANAQKGVTVRITQKSYPFGISKNIPDMNFNVFNTLSDKQIENMYQTRRFLKPNYLAKRITNLQTNSKIEANNGIIQKTIFVNTDETKNNLSIAINYLKNGQFPRKNSNLKLDKQTYSLVVQFIENK